MTAPKPSDVTEVAEWLKRHGIKEWHLQGDNVIVTASVVSHYPLNIRPS